MSEIMTIVHDSIRDDAIYTPVEIGHIVKVSASYVREEIKRGNLKGFSFGPGMQRTTGAAVKLWIEAGGHIEPPAAEPKARMERLARAAARAIEECQPADGFVYFIRCENFVKVGYASKVEYRLQGLRYGTPFEIELLGSIPASVAAEKRIHALLAQYRHRYEWFRLTKRIRNMIAELCE